VTIARSLLQLLLRCPCQHAAAVAAVCLGACTAAKWVLAGAAAVPVAAGGTKRRLVGSWKHVVVTEVHCLSLLLLSHASTAVVHSIDVVNAKIWF